MSRLDEIQKGIDARMAAIQGRIFGTPPNPVRSSVAPAASHASRTGVVQPLLSTSDLESVKKLALQIVGFAPGASIDNLPPNFPSELKELMCMVAEVAKRQEMPIGSAVLTVIKGGRPIGMQQLPYMPTAVFQNGIPEDTSKPECEIAYKVAQSAAYFGSRLGASCFDTIGVLWALVDATCNLDEGALRLDYALNAFSSPMKQGSRQAVLCFSPRITDISVVCHEMTHSVSHDLVGWGQFYVTETGAINESCSDIFGKFAEFAWNGRDMSDPNRWKISDFRDMAHPSSMKGRSWKPADYYLEPPDEGNPKSGWMVVDKPSGANDNGGVHINNGVLTRLCFLLCEGENFTRKDGKVFAVTPIGFDRAEALLARTFLGGYLTARPSVHDVYHAIVRSAADLGFSEAEQKSVQSACDAVNIIPMNSQFNQRSHSMICETRSLRGLGEDIPAALARAYSDELGLSVAGSGYVCDDCGQVSGVRGAERSLKYRQTFNEMPVFGSSAVARVNESSEVTYLNSGFSRRLGLVRAAGTVDAAAASKVVREESGGLDVLSCEKVVFDPELFGRSGEPVVAWHVESGLPGNPSSHYVIDASDGSVLFEASLQID